MIAGNNPIVVGLARHCAWHNYPSQRRIASERTNADGAILMQVHGVPWAWLQISSYQPIRALIVRRYQTPRHYWIFIVKHPNPLAHTIKEQHMSWNVLLVSAYEPILAPEIARVASQLGSAPLAEVAGVLLVIEWTRKVKRASMYKLTHI
jgi:hypothetical protein